VAYRQQKQIHTLVKDPQLVESRRQQIIDAAVGLFVRKGFHGTTTREIAREAKFSIGTLYEYVASKEDILYLVCDHIHAEMEMAIRRAIRDSDSGLATLRLAIRAYVEVCDRMQDNILLIYQVSKALPADSLRYVLKNDERITMIFADLIRKGQQDGSLRFDDPKYIQLMAHDIIVLGHMWTFRRWFLRKQFTLEEYIQTQSTLVLDRVKAIY
jgi:AcrR family transcriptional regulator